MALARWDSGHLKGIFLPSLPLSSADSVSDISNGRREASLPSSRAHQRTRRGIWVAGTVSVGMSTRFRRSRRPARISDIHRAMDTAPLLQNVLTFCRYSMTTSRSPRSSNSCARSMRGPERFRIPPPGVAAASSKQSLACGKFPRSRVTRPSTSLASWIASGPMAMPSRT